MYEVDPANAHTDSLTKLSIPPLDHPIKGPADLRALIEKWEKLDSLPRTLSGREAGIDQSWGGLNIRTLLTGDESSGRQCFHDVVLGPSAGLPLHFRDHGDTYWCVVSGEVDLTIGSLTERVGPGGFGYAPCETTQGVMNRGSTAARLLLAYYPAGSDRAFSEAHERWARSASTAVADYTDILEKYGFHFGFDEARKNDALVNGPVDRLDYTVESLDQFQALRAAWRLRSPTPKLVSSVGTPTAHVRSTVSSNVLVNGDDDSGRAVFVCAAVQPGHTAPTHHQPSEEECFYVLEGSIRLTCGSLTAVVGPGAFAFAPRFATHTFHNPGDRPARMIIANSPAGHERGFEMMVRERKNPSPRTSELIAAHGWTMHQGVDLAHR